MYTYDFGNTFKVLKGALHFMEKVEGMIQAVDFDKMHWSSQKNVYNQKVQKDKIIPVQRAWGLKDMPQIIQ